GNHGEDVKELYYYTDGIPSHAYMRMLYKYPQNAFPYDVLVKKNKVRGVHEQELELIDTGVFDEQRYFDVTIEYAKAVPDDILMRVSVENRGPDPVPLHLLPKLWARNTWSWYTAAKRPLLKLDRDRSVAAIHPDLAPMRLYADLGEFLFCENE